MQGKGVQNCMTHFVAESSRCMLLRTIVTMLRMPNLFFNTFGRILANEKLQKKCICYMK